MVSFFVNVEENHYHLCVIYLITYVKI